MTPTELQNFKARYFAAHWEQEAIMNGLRKSINVIPYWFHYIDYILLTPLSKITDEDAIEVARICSDYFPTGSTDRFNIDVFTNVYGRKFVTFEPSYKSKFIVESAVDITKGADFLRSRGYAIPFGGKSVQELIDMGLLKLRE